MADKINILGIEMDCLSAKEAMLQAIQFMETDSVDTIEILSMDALMDGRDDLNWKELLKEIKVVLPGEAEILEAADVYDRVKLKEAGNRTFFKMLMKYFQKNKKRIFLLADTEEALRHAETVVGSYNRGLRLSGSALLDPDGGSEENVINVINGTETDCILSVLLPPYQEQFIVRNRTLLNTKLWLGCGSMLEKVREEQKPLRQIRHFFLKTMFRRRVEKQQKED